VRARPAIGPAPVLGDIGRPLPSLPEAPIDDHPHRGIAGEVVLKLARQLRIAPGDDEQEAIGRARQCHGSAPTDRVARIGEQYRTGQTRPRTYSEIDLA